MIEPSQRPVPDNTQHSYETSMFPAEFEPAISASKRLQTQAIRSTATGIVSVLYTLINQLITLSIVTASSDNDRG